MAKLTMGEFREWVERMLESKDGGYGWYKKILSKLSEVDEGVELDRGSIYGMAMHIVDHIEDIEYDQIKGKRGKLVFFEEGK